MRKIINVILLIIVIAVAYTVLIPISIVQYGRNRIYTQIADIPQYNVAIVFGAGLTAQATPSDILKDRLNTAYQLYLEGKIERILISGDNTSEGYSEPQAMYDYLVFTLDVDPEDVVRDFAGLRTYDTCARAKNIWDIDKAILISQGYHLSRAIFTCSRLGIDSTGYSATQYGYDNSNYYKLREIFAIHKAVLDVYVIHPEYIGGGPELDFQE
ncbi:MAG: ElyC/SanA/YdcF family protein [Candidatus Dojkabacteria bacterium]|jgi:vancomycin permeability regulator SanA|nr:ElyC/SanA/YdcF family protein [Candidatus Dojkabacteria bacterium]